MLDKKIFLKCINTLLIFGSVEPDDKRNELFYKLLANDFENKEFSDICADICKTESLFGKYPEPKMFYDRKQKDKSDMVSIVEGMFYLDDTMPEYKPYLEGMSDEEVEKVWKWIMDNKYGEDVSKEWIIERIKQFRKPQVKDLEQPNIFATGLLKRIPM